MQFWSINLVGTTGWPFQSSCGSTQGDPMSPRFFNLMIDAMVREWLQQFLGDEVSPNGPKEDVESYMTLFYVDVRILADRFSKRVKVTIDTLLGLFSV